MSLSQKLKSGTITTNFETLYRADVVSDLLGWNKENIDEFKPNKHCDTINNIDYISFQGLLYVIPLYNFGTYKNEEWSKALFPS